MTISTAYAALTYNGDGATTAFAVTWPFFSGTLRVTAIDADGVETVKTITTHYTVAGGTDSDGLPATGTVTMLSAPASGTTLRIERRTTKTQSSSWTNAGPYQAKTLESALDKLTLLAQEGISGGSGGGSPGSGDALTLDTSGATDFWDGAGYVLSDLADPVSDQDAATKAYVDAFAAAAEAANEHAISAAASAVAASDSADDAAASAVLASGSATSAASSATNAANSATSASTSAGVAVAAAGFQFVFDNPTTMADPGAGVVRFNHATLASVTAIAIDDLAADTGNPDVSPWILTWDDSTNTTKGLLRLRKASAASTYVDFNVTGLTDNAGWSQIAVTYVGSNGTISDGDSLIVTFAPIGNKGIDGAGAGDVIGPASSVDGEIALFSSTTGKEIKRATTTGLLKATSGVIAAAAAGTDYYAPSGTDVAIADGGTGASTAATAFTNLKQAASETATGVVELATNAETQTGTDTARAITPANLTAKEATSAQYMSNTSDRILTTDQAWAAGELVTLSDAATISVDMSTFINATVTLAGNRTLGSPTNEKVGQSGVIYIVQDATGSRTLAYGSDWKFAGGTAPTLSTAANAVDALFYAVRATNFVVANLVKDVK